MTPYRWLKLVEMVALDRYDPQNWARLVAPDEVRIALDCLEERGVIAPGIHAGCTFRDPVPVWVGELLRRVPYHYRRNPFVGLDDDWDNVIFPLRIVEELAKFFGGIVPGKCVTVYPDLLYFAGW